MAWLMAWPFEMSVAGGNRLAALLVAAVVSALVYCAVCYGLWKSETNKKHSRATEELIEESIAVQSGAQSGHLTAPAEQPQPAEQKPSEVNVKATEEAAGKAAERTTVGTGRPSVRRNNATIAYYVRSLEGLLDAARRFYGRLSHSIQKRVETVERMPQGERAALTRVSELLGRTIKAFEDEHAALAEKNFVVCEDELVEAVKRVLSRGASTEKGVRETLEPYPEIEKRISPVIERFSPFKSRARA